MPREKKEIDSDLIFRVVEMFFREMTATEIKDELNVTREQVYPLLARAREMGMVRLVPPVAESAAAEVAKKFGHDKKTITVVNMEGQSAGEQVATKGAEITFELIKKIEHTDRSPVGIGLGPGRATLDLSRALGSLVAADMTVPRLKLVAISAGCPATSPEYAPVSFFNLFPRRGTEKGKGDERIGLFAETLLSAGDFELLKRRRPPGVDEALKEKEANAIDIVVTGMGDIDDPHDLLGIFLKAAGVDCIKLGKKNGWVGNVQYRPFTAKGPVTEDPTFLRAVTLFELDDFTTMAATKNKHVVLIARQCGICGKTRASALRPLLEEPKLKVWSELVMDRATARELLA